MLTLLTKSHTEKLKTKISCGQIQEGFAKCIIKNIWLSQKIYSHEYREQRTLEPERINKCITDCKYHHLDNSYIVEIHKECVF